MFITKRQQHLLVKILYWSVLAILAFLSCFLAASSLHTSSPIRLFAVQSRSMSPSLPAGSLIFVQATPNYEPGEIISFKVDSSVITHRIQEIHLNGDQAVYLTKGDANKNLDTQSVTQDQIIGKMMFSLPYFGYLISLAKTKLGLLVIIGLPTFLILYYPIKNLNKKLKKRKKNK